MQYTVDRWGCVQVVRPAAAPAPQTVEAPKPKCARCRKTAALPSRKSCAGCLEYDRIKAAIHRAEAKEINGCLVCKAPVKKGTHVRGGKQVPWSHCEEHLVYHRARYRK